MVIHFNYTQLNRNDRIRIANFNAPEKEKKGGKAAANRLKRLIGGKTVTIKPVAKDKYGRNVSDVVVNRKDLKKQLKNMCKK